MKSCASHRARTQQPFQGQLPIRHMDFLFSHLSLARSYLSTVPPPPELRQPQQLAAMLGAQHGHTPSLLVPVPWLWMMQRVSCWPPGHLPSLPTIFLTKQLCFQSVARIRLAHFHCDQMPAPGLVAFMRDFIYRCVCIWLKTH